MQVPREFIEAPPSEITVSQAWFVDTQEHGPRHPIKADMWAGWNLGTRPVLGHTSAVHQPSWWEARGVANPWEGIPERTLEEAWEVGTHPSLR